MSEAEMGVLCKIRDAQHSQRASFLLPGEYEILEQIIQAYAKPLNS